MRTEKEIYDLVLNFAFQDERIRIVTLEGSRTNVNIPKDNLQDYDITFFVIDMGEFLKSDDWLSVFGNRIMMQKPEDMELFPPEEKGFSYIMLFDDGVKIDLTLLPVSMLEEYLTRDKLVKIMLDKDNMIKTEIVPTDEDYYIKCPTERKFDDCCNEFWNVATYVSKGLLRGEILFAIDHMNEVLRHELLRMISWYVGNTDQGIRQTRLKAGLAEHADIERGLLSAWNQWFGKNAYERPEMVENLVPFKEFLKSSKAGR